ncbi:MAG TPA: HYR domain-containing protein, partial [Methylomirabilota bacterium]|nr:HYR domain-containing protein [Methylomirabilota bacterium]
DDGGGPALYAGGSFTIAGGVAANRVAKWNGASWSALGSQQEDQNVYVLAAYDDGSGPALYAGGDSVIARWDGVRWSVLAQMNGGVVALTVYDDGGGPALYAGGGFTLAGGLAANRIAKWDGASWSALGSGMNRGVSALTGYDDGSGPALYAGGGFTIAFDSHDSFLAKWQCSDTIPPTLSCPQAVFAVDAKTGPPGEIVTFEVTATDACDSAPSVVCVPPSGSFFPRGTTTVTCTATDASGNQATCTFPVTVEPPRRRR